MLKREHIERLLAVNGVTKDAPDDEIKALLLSARWHQEDVEAALLVLRENPKTHAESVSSVHHVFNSDSRLNPETVNALLGIEIQAKNPGGISNRRKKDGRTVGFYVSVIVAGFVLSLVFLTWLMWSSQTGFFHVT